VLNPTAHFLRFVLFTLVLVLGLAGCAAFEGTRSLPSASVGDSLAAAASTRRTEETASGATTSPVPSDQESVQKRDAPFYQPGTGIFVKSATPSSTEVTETGEVTLNFENTNLLEVVKVVLADLLEKNYVVDPAVQGAVTLQTSKPLRRENLIPTLELLLRMNGAALVRRDDIYHVVPRQGATRGLVSPQLGNSSAPLPSGYSVRIVPLQYISATEMHKILEPLVVAGNIVRVDTARNLLILAGTGQEMALMLETVAVFDVDWLAGMSIGMFTPNFVDAKSLLADLENIFGDQSKGPLAGLVKFTVIERLNALLAISPRQEYLQKVSDWIDRLDLDTGGAGQRLFIYHVQNGKATDLAGVLTQVFEDRDAGQSIPPPELAP